MSELRVTSAGQTYTFTPDQAVGIGRSTQNAVVVTDPVVSREHARVTWDGSGWMLDDLGKGRTFVGGMAVGSVPVRGTLEVRLASPLGPAVRIEATADQAPGPRTDGGPPAGSPLATSHGHARTDQVRHGRRLRPWRGRGTGGPAPDYDQVLPEHARPDSPGGDFATAVHILIPVRSWLKDPGWTQGSRLLVIIYGLLPSLFVVLFSATRDVAAPGWAYSLAIAPLWAVAFWLLIKPGHITRLIAWLAAGIVAIVLILLPTLTLPWENALDATADPHSLLPWIYGVGLAEEVTKALPILIAALALRWIWKITLDVRVWMFLGTIAGLAFGVRESVLYTAADLNLNVGAQHEIVLILSFALRVFVDGFQHAVWAGISAFFIGMGVNYRRRRIPLIAFGILLPAVLHGLYDWSTTVSPRIGHWLWIALEALSLVLFIGYTMSAATIERQVRDTPLFRGESMVMDRAAVAEEPKAG